MIKISKNSNINWKNNQIQFVRLISELETTGIFTTSVMQKLQDEMGLTESDITDIIDRAQCEWDEIKTRI